MADSLTLFIVLPLVLLKVGIWICCCLARSKRQQSQQGVIIVQPNTAVIQPNVMRQGFQDRSGLIVNEFPTPMSSPEYGCQADGNAPQYMHCAGMTRDNHPITNRCQKDTVQPQSPMHAPPTYEDALKSRPV